MLEDILSVLFRWLKWNYKEQWGSVIPILAIYVPQNVLQKISH